MVSSPFLRLYVLSDLHLEREEFDPPPVEADVIVLAGDVAMGSAALDWLRAWAPARPVLYVLGNHEFYGHALPDLVDEVRAAAEPQAMLLENDEAVVDGVRFLGCTLWSDFDFDGPEHRDRSMEVCERLVNDFHHITFAPQGRTLRARDTRMLHVASRRWLESRLAAPHDGPTVVITHHQPLVRMWPTSDLYRALGGAFATDLTGLMGDRVDLWIYGHTHRVADLNVRGTRVVSNPRGYPHQPVDGFDPALVVEL